MSNRLDYRVFSLASGIMILFLCPTASSTWEYASAPDPEQYRAPPLDQLVERTEGETDADHKHGQPPGGVAEPSS